MQGSRRDPLGLAHPGRVLLATSLSILFVDQVTKSLVRWKMPERAPSVDLISHVIRLTSVRNTGAAFGLFPGRQPVFMLTSALVLFAIAAYWRRARPTQWPVVIALAMVTAGALGNLIDRALIGRVTDFLEFAFVSFPVFNVADIGIVGGVGVLMAWILFGPETPAESEDVAETEDEAGSSAGAKPPAEPAPSASLPSDASSDHSGQIGAALPAEAGSPDATDLGDLQS